MKYTFQSIKYITKNFIFLFPFVIVPAFCFALSIDEMALETVLRSLFSGHYEQLDFDTIFRSVSFLGFSSGWTVLSGLCGFLTLVLGVSLLMAFTDRHMRIGKRGYHGVFSKLNDNIVSTFGVAFILLLCYELFALILSALFFFAFQMAKKAIVYVFCVVAYSGMHIALLFVITIGYLWLPCMQVTGFRTFEALRYSQQLCHPIKWKIILNQLWLLVLSEGVIAASVFIPADNVVPTLVATAFYAYMIMLFCVRMQVVYFDRAQIERADLTTYYGR